jgi:hypothetical protein
MSSYNPYQPPATQELTAGPAVGPGDISVGRMFGGGFTLFRENFAVIAGVILVISAPIEVLKNLIAYSAPSDDMNYGMMRFEMLIGAAVTALTTPSIVYAAVEHLRTGQPVGVGAALKYGATRWGRSFGYRFYAGIIVLGGLLLLLIPGIMLLTRYAVAEEVIALDRDERPDPLARSRDLTAGHRWTVLWAFLLAFVVALAVPVAGGALMAFYDTWWTSALVDVTTAVALGLVPMVGTAFWISLANRGGDAAWLSRVRWVQPGGEAQAA